MVRKFDLVIDGVPRRLEIKFKIFIRDGVISLDGKEIGRFKNKKELADGLDIHLDNNHVLRILFSNQVGTQQVGFIVSLDGEEVSGSAGDPDQIYEITSAVFYIISGLNIILSALYFFNVIDFFVVNNAHASSMLIFGMIMGISANLIKQKNGIVLIFASTLFIAEAIMSMNFWATMHSNNIGGVYTSKFFLIVPMIKCIYHHYFSKGKKDKTKTQYSTEEKVNMGKELNQMYKKLILPCIGAFAVFSLITLGIAYACYSIPKNNLFESYSIIQYIHENGEGWLLAWVVLIIFASYTLLRLFTIWWLKADYQEFSRLYYAVHGEIKTKLTDFFLGTASLIYFIFMVLFLTFSYTAVHENGVIYSSILTGEKDYKFEEVERVVLATKWENFLGKEVNGAWMHIHFKDGEYQKFHLSNDKQKELAKVKYIQEVLKKTGLTVEKVGYNPYIEN